MSFERFLFKRDNRLTHAADPGASRRRRNASVASTNLSASPPCLSGCHRSAARLYALASVCASSVPTLETDSSPSAFKSRRRRSGVLVVSSAPPLCCRARLHRAASDTAFILARIAACAASCVSCCFCHSPHTGCFTAAHPQVEQNNTLSGFVASVSENKHVNRAHRLGPHRSHPTRSAPETASKCVSRMVSPRACASLLRAADSVMRSKRRVSSAASASTLESSRRSIRAVSLRDACVSALHPQRAHTAPSFPASIRDADVCLAKWCGDTATHPNWRAVVKASSGVARASGANAPSAPFFCHPDLLAKA